MEIGTKDIILLLWGNGRGYHSNGDEDQSFKVSGLTFLKM